jgi:hypothetical protein
MGQAIRTELFGEAPLSDIWGGSGTQNYSGTPTTEAQKSVRAYEDFVDGEHDYVDPSIGSASDPASSDSARAPNVLARLVRPPPRQPYVKRTVYNETASLVLYRLCQHAQVRVNQIEELLRLGADPNYCTRERMSNNILHLLVRRGSFECVQCIIAAGADTNATNGFNQTPLILASDTTRTDDSVKIVRLLLSQKNRKLEFRDSGGNSALIGAIFKSNPWICR